jgi:hypothetical protein
VHAVRGSPGTRQTEALVDVGRGCDLLWSLGRVTVDFEVRLRKEAAKIMEEYAMGLLADVSELFYSVEAVATT